MDGFRLDQEDGAVTTAGRGNKETEDSSWSPNPDIQVQHRPSKRHLHCQQGLIGLEVLFHDRSTYSNMNNTSSNERASLENDIELLQLRLRQEKSTRLMLERALGRASFKHFISRAQSFCHTEELIDEIKLLEEDVANREQQVLTLYRSVFDNCVSRQPSEQNSGKASPAHMKHTSRKHPSIISGS